MSSLSELFSPIKILQAFGDSPYSREMSINDVQALEYAQSNRLDSLLKDLESYPDILDQLDDYTFISRLSNDLYSLMNCTAIDEHDVVRRLRHTVEAMAEETVLTEFEQAWNIDCD